MRKLILIGLIFGINTVFAQPIATVLFATPKVVAVRNNTEYPLSRGSSLEVGDSIVTGPGALINIKYKNGTLVNIGNNSRYKILAFSPKPSDVQIKAELTEGKIKFKTTGKSNEILKTPVIAMAITGTTAEVFVKSTKLTYFNLVEGNINNYTPGSYKATPQGVEVAPFPTEGHVSTPAGSDGSISDNETTENITSESNNATDTTQETADTVGFVQTTQVTDQVSSEASVEAATAAAAADVAVVAEIELADISLGCISVI